MSKFFRSFLIAFSVTFILHLLGAIYNSIDDFFDETAWNDFFKNLPISFSLFLVPISFSIFYYDVKKSNLKNFLKPILLSILVLSTVEIIYLGFIYVRPNFKFIDAVFYRVVFIGSFISFFTTLICIIKSKKKIRNDGEIKFSWKIVLSVPFFASLIYALIILLSSGYNINLLFVISRFLPTGIILALITAFFFKQNSYLNNSKKIVIHYILNLIIVVVFINFLEIFSIYDPRSFYEKLLRNFIPSIIISSPYYLLVLGTIHLYFLNLSNKQEKQFLSQQSLANQLNYQQLKNQLSPHFLFNNINVLSSFIEENPQKAVAYSNNLADIYHYFLEQEKQDVVKVVDEINFAEKYLQLLKYRFEEGLDYTINIASEIKQKCIVATILQQVLENVIKHNIIDKTSLIHINISSKENYLIVSNNKNLKRNKQLKSNKGIENIKQRISFFTEEKVIIEDTNETYSIKLPILETI